MSDNIPNFIVHYNRGEPFRSITSLAPDSVDEVLKKLLRDQFIKIGGKPILKNPIYFFLGRHSRFEEHDRNLGYMLGYMVSLGDIDPHAISFSYGDSMFCFNEENRLAAGEKYQNPLCEELYLLEGLPGLFTHPKFPKTEPLHIEAHLWVTPDPVSVMELS
jgi:hypothetical protein